MKICHSFCFQLLLMVGSSLPVSVVAYSAALLEKHKKKNHFIVYSKTIAARQLLNELKIETAAEQAPPSNNSSEGQDRGLMVSEISSTAMSAPTMMKEANKERRSNRKPRKILRMRNLGGKGKGKGKGKSSSSPSESPSSSPSASPSNSPSDVPSASPTTSNAPTKEFSLDVVIEQFEDDLLPAVVNAFDTALSTGEDSNFDEVFLILEVITSSLQRTVDRVSGKAFSLVEELIDASENAISCVSSEDAFFGCATLLFNSFIGELLTSVQELPSLLTDAVNSLSGVVTNQAQRTIDELSTVVSGIVDDIIDAIPSPSGGGLFPTRKLFIGDFFSELKNAAEFYLDLVTGAFTFFDSIRDFLEDSTEKFKQNAGFYPPPVIVDADGMVTIQGKFLSRLNLFAVNELTGALALISADALGPQLDNLCTALFDITITVSIPLQQICEIVTALPKAVFALAPPTIASFNLFGKLFTDLTGGYNVEQSKQIASLAYANEVRSNTGDELVVFEGETVSAKAVAVFDALESIGISVEFQANPE